MLETASQRERCGPFMLTCNRTLAQVVILRFWGVCPAFPTGRWALWRRGPARSLCVPSALHTPALSLGAVEQNRAGGHHAGGRAVLSSLLPTRWPLASTQSCFASC